jgi:hypothetical protein
VAVVGAGPLGQLVGMCASVVRIAGRVVMVGVLVDEPLRYRADLLRLIGARRLDPARIISHTLPLTEAPEAYRMFDAREATKVVLRP